MDPHAATDFLQTAAAAAAVTRLSYLNLFKQFPSLFAYLILLAVINLVFGLLNPVSTVYFWCYLVLEPLKWIFSIFAVRELFALTFHSYPGIRTVGRWATWAGVVFALVVSLLAALLFWNGGPRGRDVPLFYFEVSQRSVVFTLALVIVTILVFLSKYPLHLGRNTMASSVFFSVLLLSEALRLVIDSLAPRLFNHYVDWSHSVFNAVCLFGWAAMLRPEPATAPAQFTFTTPREDQLLQQLNALNQMMTRAARR